MQQVSLINWCGAEVVYIPRICILNISCDEIDVASVNVTYYLHLELQECIKKMNIIGHWESKVVVPHDLL